MDFVAKPKQFEQPRIDDTETSEWSEPVRKKTTRKKKEKESKDGKKRSKSNREPKAAKKIEEVSPPEAIAEPSPREDMGTAREAKEKKLPEVIAPSEIELEVSPPEESPEQIEERMAKETELRMRSFVNTDIYKTDDEQISYLRLQRHIEQNHPTT